MIRMVLTETNAEDAIGMGGEVERKCMTVLLDLPEIEAWLKEPREKGWTYVQRAFTGIEFVKEDPNAE